ncbi:hypothetical protein EV424DRAFT_1349351 [Suillus variegatus]|nr:hypothetical protein EV424DRAFT_1349351 [Suillus variegatus]
MTLLVFMLPRQVPAQCCALHVPSLERTCQMTGKPPHLKSARKNVSLDEVDPGLSRGWSYFVKEHGFKSFLNDTGTLPQEKSTCASHSTVNLADTRNTCGLAATGVGTVDCAHHNLKRLYVNMDYLLFSTLQHTRDIVILNISYDIACQWSKHIWTRMSSYPSTVHFDHTDKKVAFLVPKFYLPAHIAACQIGFLFNPVKGVGQTDGEAPQQGWANINPVATSTREMGLGSRRDTLDDHFGDFNWKKVTNFAMSQAAVRLSLAQKEASNLECGINVSLHSDISPSILISSGIDYEDQQCCLWRDHSALGVHATDPQLANFQEHSNTLQCKIAQWCTIQLLYLPSMTCVRTSNIESSIDSTQEEKPADIKLWLLSQIRQETLLPCNDSLSQYEWDLRHAQAFDALNDLHRHLRLRTHLHKFKDAQIRGAIIKNIEINDIGPEK